MIDRPDCDRLSGQASEAAAAYGTGGSNASTLWRTVLATSPLAAAHGAITVESERVTRLIAQVRLTAVAETKASADTVASILFAALQDDADLRAAVAASVPAQSAGAVSLLPATALRAQYQHPDRGPVVIEGALPPPPPAAPPLRITPIEETVDAVAATVTAIVATTVAASVAGAVGGVIASSVTTAAASAASAGAAGAAGGGAAGGAGGGGGASAGGLMPLLFGVQRFSASSGIAVPKSELQTGVADSMEWAKGDLGLVGREPGPGGRRLGSARMARGALWRWPCVDEWCDTEAAGWRPAPASPWQRDWDWSRYRWWWLGGAEPSGGRRLAPKGGGGSKGDDGEGALADDTLLQGRGSNASLVTRVGPQQSAFDSLLSTLTLFGILCGIASAITACGHTCWRRRVNRRFYTEKKLDVSLRRSLSRRAKFAALPAFLIWPSLSMIAVNFTLTGSVQAATEVLTARSGECGRGCEALAAVVLALAALYFLGCTSLLWHFHVRHRAGMWEPTEDPATPAEVEDPIYRQVSKLRVRCLPKGRRYTIMDRARGEFVKPEVEVEEPARSTQPTIEPRPLELAWTTPARGDRTDQV